MNVTLQICPVRGIYRTNRDDEARLPSDPLAFGRSGDRNTSQVANDRSSHSFNQSWLFVRTTLGECRLLWSLIRSICDTVADDGGEFGAWWQGLHCLDPSGDPVALDLLATEQLGTFMVLGHSVFIPLGVVQRLAAEVA